MPSGIQSAMATIAVRSIDRSSRTFEADQRKSPQGVNRRASFAMPLLSVSIAFAISNSPSFSLVTVPDVVQAERKHLGVFGQQLEERGIGIAPSQF